MRTTVTLEPDVAAAVEQLRRERSVGVSAAINELARAGLAGPKEREPFVPPTGDLGLTVDVTNVWEAIELLEGLSAR